MPTFTTPSSWPHSRSPGSTRESASDPRLRQQPFTREEEERVKGAKVSTSQGMRGHVVAMSGELVGTLLFLWFAFAGESIRLPVYPLRSGPGAAGHHVHCFVLRNVRPRCSWAFYRISGGLFNPAGKFGMMVSGALQWVWGLLLIPAQIAGAIISAGLNTCMLPGPIAVITTPTNGTSVRQGLFIEAFLTSLLVFVVLMLAAETHATVPVHPNQQALWGCFLAALAESGQYAWAGVRRMLEFEGTITAPNIVPRGIEGLRIYARRSVERFGSMGH